MKRFLLITFLTGFSFHNLMAQTGSIIGTIKSSDNKPVEYVNIFLQGTTKGTSTNEEGIYRINNVKEGTYLLVTSYVGLEEKKLKISVSSGQVTKVPEIVLDANQEDLQEIIIHSNREYGYAEVLPSKSLRLGTPILEVPQNIQVITDKVIKDQQAIDMMETVTRNVSGAQMIEHWGTFARVNMRGFKIPAFRNGMNVDIPWGPLTEDMSIVDKIEFVKGPAGFMLSSGEPGGLYNVVTKKPDAYQQNEFSFTVGSFNTLRSTIDLGGQLTEDGKVLYRFNAMGLTKGSHRDYEYNNRYTLAPSVQYNFNEQTSVTAEYIHQYSQLSLIGAAYVFSANEFGDLPRDFTLAEPNIDPSNIDEHNLFINFNHEIDNNWEITAKIGYQNYEQTGNSLWTAGIQENGNIIRTLGSFDAFNESKLGQFYVNGDITTGVVKHSILAGLDMGHKDYFADWWQSGVIGRNMPFNVYNPTYGVPADSLPIFDRSQSIRQRATSGSYPAIVGQRYSSLYVQDQLELLNDKVRLTLGGRYTAYNGWSYGSSTDDQVVSPRLGLNVTVAKNTSVYGLYDQSFIPQAGLSIEGNAFIPVRANNIEAGLKKEWLEGRWNSTFAIYQITKENLVVGHPDPDVLAQNPYAQIQLGEVQSQGIELDVQGEIAKGLKLILNYANTNVEVTEDTNEANVGTSIPGHARHMTNGWLSYSLQTKALNGLGVSLGYQYQADRSSWYWGADNKSALPDYFRLDGAISYAFKDFDIRININNILNKYLYSGAAYASYYYWQTEPGTNFRLNISYRF